MVALNTNIRSDFNGSAQTDIKPAKTEVSSTVSTKQTSGTQQPFAQSAVEPLRAPRIDTPPSNAADAQKVGQMTGRQQVNSQTSPLFAGAKGFTGQTQGVRFDKTSLVRTNPAAMAFVADPEVKQLPLDMTRKGCRSQQPKQVEQLYGTGWVKTNPDAFLMDVIFGPSGLNFSFNNHKLVDAHLKGLAQVGALPRLVEALVDSLCKNQPAAKDRFMAVYNRAAAAGQPAHQDHHLLQNLVKVGAATLMSAATLVACDGAEVQIKANAPRNTNNVEHVQEAEETDDAEEAGDRIANTAADWFEDAHQAARDFDDAVRDRFEAPTLPDSLRDLPSMMRSEARGWVKNPVTDKWQQVSIPAHQIVSGKLAQCAAEYGSREDVARLMQSTPSPFNQTSTVVPLSSEPTVYDQAAIRRIAEQLASDTANADVISCVVNELSNFQTAMQNGEGIQMSVPELGSEITVGYNGRNIPAWRQWYNVLVDPSDPVLVDIRRLVEALKPTTGEGVRSDDGSVIYETKPGMADAENLTAVAQRNETWQAFKSVLYERIMKLPEYQEIQNRKARIEELATPIENIQSQITRMENMMGAATRSLETSAFNLSTSVDCSNVVVGQEYCAGSVNQMTFDAKDLEENMAELDRLSLEIQHQIDVEWELIHTRNYEGSDVTAQEQHLVGASRAIEVFRQQLGELNNAIYDYKQNVNQGTNTTQSLRRIYQFFQGNGSFEVGSMGPLQSHVNSMAQAFNNDGVAADQSEQYLAGAFFARTMEILKANGALAPL